MYKAKIGNKFKDNSVSAMFVALNQAQKWVDRMVKDFSKQYGKSERIILKGSEEYDTSLVISEEVVTIPQEGADITQVYVHLAPEYETSITEMNVTTGKTEDETTFRIEEARQLAQPSKNARENSMLVLDYFVHLINKRSYSLEDKIEIQSNNEVQLALSFLYTGNLVACKQVLKDLKSTKVIKKVDLNDTIRLINDLTRF